MWIPSTKIFYLISAVVLGTILPSFVNASLRGISGIYHQEERATRVLEESVVGCTSSGLTATPRTIIEISRPVNILMIKRLPSN
jgi:hypothetical protein